jgi:Fic family protein
VINICSPGMLNLQNLESIKKKYYYFYLNGIDLSNPVFRHFIIESAYHSSTIHGCDFSFSETLDFLESGKTAQGKDFFDYLIIQNIYDSGIWFYEKFRANFRLDLDILVELNSRLLKGIEYRVKNTGDYTAKIRVIKGDLRKDPLNLINDNRKERELNHQTLKNETRNLIDNIYYSKDITLHQIADFYGKFLRLKPFDMGNGRTLRILINYLFFRAGFPFIFFNAANKIIFEEAILDFGNNSINKLIEYFEKRLETSIMVFGNAI